nr:MAG TPA: hypothetical protein [Caudoviricetes sp.]
MLHRFNKRAPGDACRRAIILKGDMTYDLLLQP